MLGFPLVLNCSYCNRSIGLVRIAEFVVNYHWIFGLGLCGDARSSRNLSSLVRLSQNE
jgi:hypothetical protein